ncbi:HEPN domain-containing protein [Ruegeria arenilitoris]|uniref:HEPN domain-containing protein n=1 Tax=Ruegeria arenilitoris TaxID=1173585 RepID=UPI00147E57AE
MLDQVSFSDFWDQFEDLKEVAQESNTRSVAEPVDRLFDDHANVFIKSYVVSACSILEAFLHEVAVSYINNVQSRFQSLNAPHNLVVWAMSGDKGGKLNGSKFGQFELAVSRKDVSEVISGNVFKTVKAFAKFGVDLESDEEFCARKDFVAATVEKRNGIVHRNDDASDLSFLDVINIVEEFVEYARAVQRVVATCPHIYTIHDSWISWAPTRQEATG